MLFADLTFPKLSQNKTVLFRTFVLKTLVALGFVLVATTVACSGEGVSRIQQSNTYPVDYFHEMHYSQAKRAQEPTRLKPASEAELFVSYGGTEGILDIEAREYPAYDATVARVLYEVNCSICHGISGTGDGPTASYLTSSDSYYASKYGEPFKSPANLAEIRGRYTTDTEIGISYFNSTIQNGLCTALPNPDDGCISVMPAFQNILTEDDIRSIAMFMFDEENGLFTSN